MCGRSVIPTILLGLAAWIGPGLASAAEAARKPAGNIVSVSGKVMIRQESRNASLDLRPAMPGKEVWVGDIITTPSDGRIKLLLQDRSIMDIGPSSLFKLDQMKAGAGGRREVDATVAYGTLRAGVTQKLEGKSHFKVRTASATMGVRGTEFVVKSELGDMKQLNQVLSAKPGELPSFSGSMATGELPKTEVTVLQGKVEVGTPPPAPNAASASSSGQAAAPPAAAPAILSSGMQLVSGGVPPTQDRGLASGAPAVRQLDQQKLTEVATGARVQDKTFEQAATIQGTTRNEEAQAKREEKREERREVSRSESRSPATDTEQRTASADTNAAAAAPAPAPASDGASSPPSASSSTSTASTTSAPASLPAAGLAAITTAVTTNVQIAIQTTAQTVRVADAINSPLAANAAVTQRNTTAPTVHTLTIQFTAPRAP